MLLRIIAVLFVSFVAFLLVSVNLGWNWFFIAWVKLVPFEDKLIHFLLMGLLSFFVNLLLDARQTSLANFRVLSGSLIVLLITTAEEFSQLLLPHRNFEILDLICNFCGILLFGKLAALMVKKIKKPVLLK